MKIINLLFVLLLLMQGNGQQNETVKEISAGLLPLHKTISDDISPYKIPVYEVKMDKGQFACIRIRQKNIGLFALVYDPLDSLIQVVDENKTGQDETINIDAVIPGLYKIKIHWNFNKPLKGNYQVTLTHLESTAGTPIGRAVQLFGSWYNNTSPGAAIAVIKDNKVVMKKVMGLASLEDKVPITTASVFEIASCSKQFTAFAVAMLIDKNKIGLADDIRKYLPEMPVYGTPVTIANLLYHTSGIRNTDVLELAGYPVEDRITLPAIVRFAAAQKKLKFTPGEMFSYSNTNYNLLAEIIARITGQTFSSWTKENIFKPLGMNSTFFKEDPGTVYAGKVLCYKPTGNGYQQRPNNYAAVGSAALCTSLDDLIKWVNSFSTRQLISKNMEILLNTTGTLNNGTKTNYGFGNFIGPQGVEHLGLVLGYRAAITRLHNPGLAVIYLANDDNDATYPRYYRIRDLLLNTPEKKLSPVQLPDVNEILQKIKEEETGFGNIDFSGYAGTYYSDELITSLKIKVESNRLILHYPRMDDIKLSRVTDDDFGLIRFQRDALKKIISFKLSGENVEFLKVDQQ